MPPRFVSLARVAMPQPEERRNIVAVAAAAAAVTIVAHSAQMHTCKRELHERKFRFVWLDEFLVER